MTFDQECLASPWNCHGHGDWPIGGQKDSMVGARLATGGLTKQSASIVCYRMRLHMCTPYRGIITSARVAHTNIHSGCVAPTIAVHVFHTIYAPSCWEGLCRLHNCYQGFESINCSGPELKAVFIADNLGKTSILLKNYSPEEFAISTVYKIRISWYYVVNISKSMILKLLWL